MEPFGVKEGASESISAAKRSTGIAYRPPHPQWRPIKASCTALSLIASGATGRFTCGVDPKDSAPRAIAAMLPLARTIVMESASTMFAGATAGRPPLGHAADLSAGHRACAASLVDLPRLPRARVVPFSRYNNKYAGGACYVVGRGPTEVDYRHLSGVSDPIFFINDAICMEKYAGKAETFFFAHDLQMRVWLDGSIRATAVLPIQGTILGRSPSVVLQHGGQVVHYHRDVKCAADVLRMGRDELADRQQLFVHSGTIHSLQHFLWYCGFNRATFIGCDGVDPPDALSAASSASTGYDPRLQNRSKTSPWWQYDKIRRAQDLLNTLFGIEATYLGTPARGHG